MKDQIRKGDLTCSLLRNMLYFNSNAQRTKVGWAKDYYDYQADAATFGEVLSVTQQRASQVMAYLSRYTLSPAAVRALRLTDTYSLHRAVYSLFEDVRGGNTQEHSGILFADKGADARERRLIILSGRAPLLPEHGTLETCAVSQEYLAASSYRFEIIINPVRRENSTGKLIPLRGREAVTDWFSAKAPTWGFCVRPGLLQVTRLEVDRFVKAGREVTLAKATLAGFLDVIDRTLFAASALQGIGRGKAFGCGFLQIESAL